MLARIAIGLVALGGCRYVVEERPPGKIWQQGAPVLVVPRRADTFDADIAATIAKRLDELGTVRVMPNPPGIPGEARTNHAACELGREVGARYVVAVATDVAVERDDSCVLSTGILQKIFVPIPIFSPLIGRPRDVTIVKVPLASSDRCIVSKAIWNWIKAAEAEVIDVADCRLAGGVLTAGDHGENDLIEPSHNIDDLISAVRKKTHLLFPAETFVREMHEGRASASPSLGIHRGEFFEVRRRDRPNESPPGNEIAVVKAVEGDTVVFDSYDAPIHAAQGDMLIARADPMWLEVVPLATASMITVDGERTPLLGGGARMRTNYHGYLIGFGAEYLDHVDADSELDWIINVGIDVGLLRHIARHVDLYAVLGGGLTLVGLPLGPEGRSRGAFASLTAGARLSHGRLFFDAEVGGVASTTYSQSPDLDANQRGPVARVGLGFTIW